MTFQENQNAFTAIRWLGALMVLLGHSYVFLGLPEPVLFGWAPPGPIGVYIFFSISGYLVAKSWERDQDVFRFLARRALRIFPGLWVCLLLTAFILGPLASHLTLRDYLSHPHLIAYLSNFYLYISYVLPGVFSGNTYPNAVNGSLWSLPVEVMLYVMVAVFGWFSRILKLRDLYVHLIASLFVVGALEWAFARSEMMLFYATDVRQLLICGGYFWVGYLLALNGWDEKLNIRYIFLLLMVWILLYPTKSWFIGFSYIVVPCLIVFIGNMRGSYFGYLNRHDYSYGIYIYAFPLQQLLAPNFKAEDFGSYLASVIIVVVLFAALSWNLVERPGIGLKSYLKTRSHD